MPFFSKIFSSLWPILSMWKSSPKQPISLTEAGKFKNFDLASSVSNRGTVRLLVPKQFAMTVK